MSCRLPTFRVMTGGIFGNMFVFFEWYCDTTESLKDSFFFHHSSCILHMYLLVVLFCFWIVWAFDDCTVRFARQRNFGFVPLQALPSAVFQCCIESMCSERRLWWQPRVLSMEEVAWSFQSSTEVLHLALPFFFFLRMLSNSPSLCTRAYWVRGFKRLEKTRSSFNCVLAHEESCIVYLSFLSLWPHFFRHG